MLKLVMQFLAIIAGLLSAGSAVAQTNRGLEQARRNYPPLILGMNTKPAGGAGPYARSCPLAGGVVEQRGGPAFEYLGVNATNPALCRMRVAGQEFEAWYGIWLTDWPGADAAYPALTRVLRGRTGDVQAFDVRMTPGMQWHDLIRNEGIEDIPLLGVTYRALKISHYREGFEGNTYRSVATVWKDMDSGLVIYATYQHISGAPEIDDPLIPTAIRPAR